MWVRGRGFLAVLAELRVTLSLPRVSLPVARPIGFIASGTRPPMVVSACQVQPFPSCESIRFRFPARCSRYYGLLTPAPARRSLLAAAPTITDGLGWQLS